MGVVGVCSWFSHFHDRTGCPPMPWTRTMLLASRQRSGHGQDQQTDATHSTAGSTGQSGSYKSVSPTDLTVSTWTFMVLLSQKHHIPCTLHRDTVILQRRVADQETWHRNQFRGTAASMLAGRFDMCKGRSWKMSDWRWTLDPAGLGPSSHIDGIIISVARAAHHDGTQRCKAWVKRRWPGRRLLHSVLPVVEGAGNGPARPTRRLCRLLPHSGHEDPATITEPAVSRRWQRMSAPRVELDAM